MPSPYEYSPEETNPLLAAALSYARRGWPVFPLRPSEKIPDGRLVRHGLNDASTDDGQLRSWWAASPAANVGLRTGLGLDVVDLDSAAARARLEALSPERGDLGSLGASVLVRTGRGWHLWFAAGGLTTRAGVLEGIDVRGSGGYVVAPPSHHPNGGQYLFVDPRTGEMGSRLPEVALNSVPSWLATLLSPEGSRVRTARESPPVLLDASAYVRVAVESECAAVARTSEGSRNDRLNRAAFSIGTLVGAGLLEHGEAEHALLEAAQRAGLTDREARRTIASGLAAGARRPRTVASDRSPQRPRRDRVETRKRPAAPGRRADLATAAVRAPRATYAGDARPCEPSRGASDAIPPPTSRARSMSPPMRTAAPDRLAEVHEQLTAAVERLVSGADWAAMLTVAARFHRYSLNNVVLIHAQMPEATRVAGYQTWKALGHQVRRGEHAIAILAPALRRTTSNTDLANTASRASDEVRDADAGSPEELPAARSRLLAGFRIAHVFDISQTDGPVLADVTPATLSGEAPAALYAGLAAEVARAGFVLVREDCAPANGRTDFARRVVTVRPDCSPAQAAKTLAHEAAHVYLHDEARFRGLGGAFCRGLAEVEAESVAYLVCAIAGLSTGEYSFPYVARWASGDLELVRSTGARVLGAARTLTAALGLSVSTPDPVTEAVLERPRETSAQRNDARDPARTTTPAHTARAVGREVAR